MVAPRFYKGIEDLPLQTSLPIISWHRALAQITGPMIPAAVLRLVPPSLRDFWLDTPIWKVIVVALVSALAALLLFVFHRAINRRETDNRVGFLVGGFFVLGTIVFRFPLHVAVPTIGHHFDQARSAVVADTGDGRVHLSADRLHIVTVHAPGFDAVTLRPLVNFGDGAVAINGGELSIQIVLNHHQNRQVENRHHV